MDPELGSNESMTQLEKSRPVEGGGGLYTEGVSGANKAIPTGRGRVCLDTDLEDLENKEEKIKLDKGLHQYGGTCP